MQITIKGCVLVFALSSFYSGIAVASETDTTQEKGLKSVMQGLLKDTQLLSEGIFLQDFVEIELAANNIAKHPTPGMKTMKKVMGNLGTEMAVFKGLDMKVHNIALGITKSASNQDMPGVVSGYHKLIDGCQSCHSQFKQRVSKILGQQ